MYILLTLLILKNSEASEGWYNNSFCMANQTNEFAPSTAVTSGDFAALDTTIGALALWWVPLGCNILRHKWNQRKIAEKIKAKPTDKNLVAYHIRTRLQNHRIIRNVLYSCLFQQQFNHTGEICSPVEKSVSIISGYAGSDVESPEHKYAEYCLCSLLFLIEGQEKTGIPQIGKTVTDYLYDSDGEFQVISDDQDRATYQPLLNGISGPLTLRSIPTILRNTFPTVLLAGVSESRKLWYFGKFAKHVFYDAGARMLWNGVTDGPGRLVSFFGSPAVLGIDVGVQYVFSKCFDKLGTAWNNDTYLLAGRCLCATLGIQASDLLLNYLVIQRVK